MAGLLLSAEQRQIIETIHNSQDNPVIKHCALILLLYDDGQMTRQIAEVVQLSPSQVRRRRRQFFLKGTQLFPQKVIPEITLLQEPMPDLPQSETQEPPIVQEPGASPPYTLTDFIADAKLLKSPGVERNDAISEAARKILRFQFAQMLLNEEGTRLGEDIEALHDMRVATRR
ncbi:MAG: CHAD domain-containing protein, partial [Anaerolineaceae bacterium]